jgi:hypothetical protein
VARQRPTFPDTGPLDVWLWRYQATVPSITPAGSGRELGSAGSGVNVLPRKMPNRDCLPHTCDPMTSLPSVLAQPM